MRRDQARRCAATPPSRLAALALALCAVTWSGCCWMGQKSCAQCGAGGCPTYCPPQGDCFGHYATHWRRWPGDCHLWLPEMLPVVEPVSTSTSVIGEPVPSAPIVSPPAGAPTPADAPSQAPVESPPVIIEPKVSAPPRSRPMIAPPVELGPDSLSRRFAYPPSGGVVPARYPVDGVRRLDSERLAHINSASAVSPSLK